MAGQGLLSDCSGSGSEGSAQWGVRQSTSCLLRQATYHQRIRIEEIGGRKYQAYASDLSSQFICMGAACLSSSQGVIHLIGAFRLEVNKAVDVDAVGDEADEHGSRHGHQSQGSDVHTTAERNPKLQQACWSQPKVLTYCQGVVAASASQQAINLPGDVVCTCIELQPQVAVIISCTAWSLRLRDPVTSATSVMSPETPSLAVRLRVSKAESEVAIARV
ncbi:MAG: hypothetical protein FRX49_10623 [Trebouxia sp. A1-2]|nr:MAG: hypothetical protein FRX49_10623 [Trebouxia sp. A1-2]